MYEPSRNFTVIDYRVKPRAFKTMWWFIKILAFQDPLDENSMTKITSILNLNKGKNLLFLILEY